MNRRIFLAECAARMNLLVTGRCLTIMAASALRFPTAYKHVHLLSAGVIELEGGTLL